MKKRLKSSSLEIVNSLRLLNYSTSKIYTSNIKLYLKGQDFGPHVMWCMYEVLCSSSNFMMQLYDFHAHCHILLGGYTIFASTLILSNVYMRLSSSPSRCVMWLEDFRPNPHPHPFFRSNYYFIESTMHQTIHSRITLPKY